MADGRDATDMDFINGRRRRASQPASQIATQFRQDDAGDKGRGNGQKG